MTIKEDTPDIDSVEILLQYMDEFKHSGQNKAAAKLIRELQNTVEKLLRICYSTYQVVGVLDADERILDVLSDPAGATDEQVEAMLPYFAPSAPLVAISDKKWSDEFAAFEAWERDAVTTSPWSAWHERATLSGQVAPKATVEPLTEIRKLASRLQNSAYSHGCIDSKDYSSDKKYIDAADKSDAALKALIDACTLLAATTPTSKATEPYLKAFVDAQMRGTGMVKVSAEGAEHIPFDEFMNPVPPCCCGEPSTIGTVHRTDGPCFIYEATSKADTGEESNKIIRTTWNAAIEKAATRCEQLNRAAPEFQRPNGISCAAAVRELKSVTPSTIKEEPTESADGVYCAKCRAEGGYCGNCKEEPTGEQL